MVLNVGTALNSQYMRYAYVMLTSLFENGCEAEDTIHVYLLHSDLTDSDQKHMAKLAEEYGQEISFLQIDHMQVPDECPITKEWPVEMYYRLMLTELLPEVDRFLYLDVDVIVNRSISALYRCDLGNAVMAVCPDAYGAPFQDVRQTLFAEQIEAGFTYFNSGVLLMDLAALRSKYSFEKYMETAAELKYELLAPDQDLLNYMHWNEVVFVDANVFDLYAKQAYRNGVTYEEVKSAVVIVHYVGEKPWQGQFAHYELEKLWWDYAYKTPFAVELMKEYIEACVCNPYIYDSLISLSNANARLNEELKNSVALCQRLVAMIK